jgi:hypothetical protein
LFRKLVVVLDACPTMHQPFCTYYWTFLFPPLSGLEYQRCVHIFRLALSRCKARVFAHPRRNPCTSFISAAGFISTARLGAGETCRFLHLAPHKHLAYRTGESGGEAVILCHFETFQTSQKRFLVGTGCAKGKPGARFWGQVLVEQAARGRKESSDRAPPLCDWCSWRVRARDIACERTKDDR